MQVNAEQAILRQKGPPPSMNSMPPSPHGSNYYNQPPPNMGWRGPRPPAFRGPPPSHIEKGFSHHHESNWGLDSHHKPRPPRPLMDIPTHAPAGGRETFSERGDSNIPPPTASAPQQPTTVPTTSSTVNSEQLEKEIVDAEKKMATLQGQISQSEQNLAAQKKVTDGQIKNANDEAIRNAQMEHLELLSHDTELSLEDFDEVMKFVSNRQLSYLYFSIFSIVNIFLKNRKLPFFKIPLPKKY